MKYLFLIFIILFMGCASTGVNSFKHTEKGDVDFVLISQMSLESFLGHGIRYGLFDNVEIGAYINPYSTILNNDELHVFFGFDTKIYFYETKSDEISLQLGMPSLNKFEGTLRYVMKNKVNIAYNLKYQKTFFYYSNTDKSIEENEYEHSIKNDDKIGLTLTIGGKSFWFELGYLFVIREEMNPYYVPESDWHDLFKFDFNILDADEMNTDLRHIVFNFGLSF